MQSRDNFSRGQLECEHIVEGSSDSQPDSFMV